MNIEELKKKPLEELTQEELLFLAGKLSDDDFKNFKKDLPQHTETFNLDRFTKGLDFSSNEKEGSPIITIVCKLCDRPF